ncbi:hypothetical protein NDU88_002272 [Pleurodeles waltl]|uniref:Uncharacterized protein n=1 Tax=Pleurodeles waltl TaxID=8319 RepID=A0AAV7RE18_PLEWA|nr:hypothetical protein NDU88_002272 [Pleurodeles waltl]
MLAAMCPSEDWDQAPHPPELQAQARSLLVLVVTSSCGYTSESPQSQLEPRRAAFDIALYIDNTVIYSLLRCKVYFELHSL